MVSFIGRREKKRARPRGDANPAKLPRCCRNYRAVSQARTPVSSRKRPQGNRNGAGSRRLACHRADARLGERLDGANGGGARGVGGGGTRDPFGGKAGRR